MLVTLLIKSKMGFLSSSLAYYQRNSERMSKRYAYSVPTYLKSALGKHLKAIPDEPQINGLITWFVYHTWRLHINSGLFTYNQPRICNQTAEKVVINLRDKNSNVLKIRTSIWAFEFLDFVATKKNKTKSKRQTMWLTSYQMYFSDNFRKNHSSV